MNRIHFLKLRTAGRVAFVASLGVISLHLMTCTQQLESTPMKPTDPIAFHHSILTIDTHVDTPLPIKRENIDLGKRYDPYEYKSKIDLPRMAEGGLDAAFFAVWTPQGARTDSGHAAIKDKALAIIDDVRAAIAPYPDRVELAVNPGDAARLQEAGKHAVYLGMENGYPIGTDLDNLDLFYDKGVRYVTLCHSSNNEICDSSTDTTEFGGLSTFGFQVVERMNDLGMMIDISHVSDETVEDVLASSKAPVIASHSCAKALCDHDRNLSDDLLRKIGEHGGVIQMNILSEYVETPAPNPSRDSARAALKKKWGPLHKIPEADRASYRAERKQLNKDFPLELTTVAKAVDHIDHMVKMAGIDHVGIGTDFDGGGQLADCYDVSELPNITIELFKRGYSEADIEKIWSGNLLRVFGEVQTYSKR